MRLDLTTWSPDQRAAITHGGHNMLVSAGAGSGKTSALVERVVRKIVEDPGCDVTQLLVVTFTEAAAAEMRERMERRLRELGETIRRTGDDAAWQHIQKQLTLMDLANISTLHSFCMEVVRRNFATLDIQPRFAILDSADGVVLRSRVFRSLLDIALTESSESFRACVARFAPDNVMHLESLVLRIYGYARSQPEPRQWLPNLAGYYQTTETGLRGLVWFADFQKWVCRMLDTAAHHLALGATLANPVEELAAYATVMMEEAERIRSAKQSLMSGESLETIAVTLSTVFAGKPRAKDHDAKEQVQYHRQQAKKLLEPVTDVLLRGESSLLADVTDLAQAVSGLSGITSAFLDQYFEVKQARGLLDFDDLEHLALEALRDPQTGEANRLRSQFIELFVDEYQDTSPIQEALMSAIARPTGNVFAVGDVKQSIYRFRMAEPNLFLDKYHRYSRCDEQGLVSLAPLGGEVIDLNANYRSRAPVVSFVNFLFEQLLSVEFGGLEYNDNARMVPAALYPSPDHQPSNWAGDPVEVHLIERVTQSGDADEATDDGRGEDDAEDQPDATVGEKDVSAAELSSTEREAIVIGRRIMELTGRLPGSQPSQVWDKQLKCYRPIQYRDIVVLMRSVRSRMNPVLEVFRQLEIPAYGATSTGFYDAIEIQWVVSTLVAIDNPRREIEFATVLKSPVGGFRDEELAQIRAHRKGNFYDAVVAYVDSAPDDGGTLPDRLKSFLKRFRLWRRYARRTTAADFILQLFFDTRLNDYVLGMPDGDIRKANLESLVDDARAYDASSCDGLFGFVTQIREGWRHDLDSGEARALAESENVVRITTIHQSKGLEYPVVFIADLGKQFNLGAGELDCLLHPSLGIAPIMVDDPTHRKWRTLPWYALQEVETREYLAEEARVLYVAFTRARERLIVVGSARNLAGLVQKTCAQSSAESVTLPAYSLFDARTPLQWLVAGLLRHPSAPRWVAQLPGDVLSSVTLPSRPMALSAPEPTWLSVHVWNTESGLSIPTLSELASSAVDVQTDDQPHDREAMIDAHSTETQVGDDSYAEVAAGLDWWQLRQTVEAPGKVSATDLRRMWSARLLRRQHASDRGKQPRFSPSAAERLLSNPTFMEQAELAPNAKGTAFHRVMMAIPFSTPPTAVDVDEALSALVEAGYITQLERSAVGVDDVAAFLASSVGKRIAQARLVMREQPFFSRIDVGESSVGHFVVVQGVIDCLVEEDDRWLLVDYKTDAVNESEVSDKAKEYQAQIAAYIAAAEAVCGNKPVEAVLYFVKPRRSVVMSSVPLEQLFQSE